MNLASAATSRSNRRGPPRDGVRRCCALGFWTPRLVGATLVGLLLLGCGETDESRRRLLPPGSAGGASGHVAINEVLPSNPDGEDWFELYYDGAEELSLEGWGVNDDLNDPLEVTFPSGPTLSPDHRYLVVYAVGAADAASASSKATVHEDGTVTVPFALRADGEQVVVADPQGNEVDYVRWRPTNCPVPRPDRGYALVRVPDGTGDFYACRIVTPGGENAEACAVTDDQ